MSVAKSKSSSDAMVAGGIIHSFGGGGIGITIHLGDEVRVVDAVLAFIQNTNVIAVPGESTRVPNHPRSYFAES